MKTKIIFKDTFSVIGKMGQGLASEPEKWILPLWKAANENFSQIIEIVRHNDDGTVCGVWGAMNDINEQNYRWSNEGKYMAGCEANIDAVAPEGWARWIIPAQTYIVADCTMETYGEVFGKLTNDENIQIVGTVHELYPEPGNPTILELYIPIASGMLFCQSCGMPMTKDEDFGTNADGSKNTDYCCHCFGNGTFFQS